MNTDASDDNERMLPPVTEHPYPGKSADLEAKDPTPKRNPGDGLPKQVPVAEPAPVKAPEDWQNDPKKRAEVEQVKAEYEAATWQKRPNPPIPAPRCAISSTIRQAPLPVRCCLEYGHQGRHCFAPEYPDRNPPLTLSGAQDFREGATVWKFTAEEIAARQKLRCAAVSRVPYTDLPVRCCLEAGHLDTAHHAHCFAMHYPDAETRPLSVEEARAFRTPTVWKLTDDDLQRKPSSVPEPGPDAPASAGAQGAAGAPAPWEVPQNHPLRLEAQKAQAAVKVLKQEQRRLVEALKSILRKAIDLGPQASVAFDELRTFVKSACAEVGISPDGSMRYRAVHAFEPLPPDPERITCVLYTNPQKRVLEAFVELLSCWEWAPRGKFNSEAALSIADRLLKRLGVKDLPKRVEPTPGACLHRRVIVTEGFAECQECRVELEYNAEMRNWTPKNYDAPRENSQSTRQRPVEGGARDHWHEFAFNLLRTHPGNVDMVGSIAAEFRSLAKHLDDANERKAKAEAWAAQERDRCGLIISAILGHGGQSDISAASVEASMCAIQMRGLLEYLLKLGDVVPSKIHAWARAALDGELNLDAMPKLAPPPAVDSGKEFFDVPIPEAPMHIISVQQQLRGCLNVVHALNSGFCLKCGGFFKPASDGEFRCPHCSFAIPPALVKDLVAEGKPILDECTEAFDAWGAEWMSRRDAENPL